jgi:hypothetical protein
MTDKKPKTWADDINPESVSKAKEILPKIDLPQPGQTPIVIWVDEEPYEVLDREDRPMMVGEATQLIPNEMRGSMVYPKSLRFNISKTISRTGIDFKKAKLTGMSLKIWSIEDNGQKFYQAELWKESPQK